MTAALLSSAVWVAGRWVDAMGDLEFRDGEIDVRAPIDVRGLFGSDRIPRADRVTQLGALVLGRACDGFLPLAGDDTSVITASTVATAHTNEKFERRRAEGKPPEPRSFPYTAPNAGAGEFTIALGARGPTLALVGGPEVGLAALERACTWIRRGAARRVAVVVSECPPPTAGAVAYQGIVAAECAAALLVGPADDPHAKASLEVRWTTGDARENTVTPWMSVRAAAMLSLLARADAVGTVRAGCLEATVRARRERNPVYPPRSGR